MNTYNVLILTNDSEHDIKVIAENLEITENTVTREHLDFLPFGSGAVIHGSDFQLLSTIGDVS